MRIACSFLAAYLRPVLNPDNSLSEQQRHSYCVVARTLIDDDGRAR